MGRVGVEFGLLNDVTLPPVVQGHGLLYVEGCGVPGRANSPSCPFFLLLQEEPSLYFPTFWESPEEEIGREGRVGREIFFSVLSSFQNSSSSREATLGHAMCFLRNSHKQSPESLSSHSALLNPPVLVSATGG